MARIVEAGKNELCDSCLKTGIRRNATKVLLAEAGDVESLRIPLCKQHLAELGQAIQQIEALLGDA